VDVTDEDGLFDYVIKNKILCKYIVNCVGYTNVDKAETDQDACTRLNVDATRNICRLALLLNATLIHLSTDYVFDGNKYAPYIEEDAVYPINFYGKTKVLAEQIVSTTVDNYFIIRTSGLYGIHGSNFVKTMLHKMQTEDMLSVVYDQIVSPTNIADLIDAIYQIMENRFDVFGTYHFANCGGISWYEFAHYIYQLSKKHHLLNNKCVSIQPISASQYNAPAPRPIYSVLDSTKISTTFDKISNRDCIEALDDYLRLGRMI